MLAKVWIQPKFSIYDITTPLFSLKGGERYKNGRQHLIEEKWSNTGDVWHSGEAELILSHSFSPVEAVLGV